MIFFSLFISCQTQDDVDFASPQNSQNISILTCSNTIPAMEWTEGYLPIEAEPGFEETLENMDFSELEDPVDISKALEKYHNEIAYALEVRPHGFASPLYHEDALQAGVLGEVLLGSLLLGKDMEHQIDIDFFWRGMHRYYTCSREFPKTLTDFKAKYGTWNMEEAFWVNSAAKCERRGLLTLNENVYIAETELNGWVRETEVILYREREDRQMEFLVYDENGNLTNRSQFPLSREGPHVVAASPRVCMGCHLNGDRNAENWGYTTLNPDAGICRSGNQ
jgi:hypothetical protein